MMKVDANGVLIDDPPKKKPLTQKQAALLSLYRDNVPHLCLQRKIVAVPHVTAAPDSDLPPIMQDKMRHIVGQHDVKRQLASFYHLLTLNKIRSAYGLVTQEVNAHMIFTGNPGTGKTTFARLVGKLLKDAEVLETGHLVEITPADLMTESICGTEIRNMKRAIQQARGGVLFIDEAHNFPDHAGKNSEFWRNAVTVLLQEMTAPATAKKPAFSVILAGYEKGMKNLLALEPGLKSRCQNFFHFTDYTPKELTAIFAVQAQQAQFTLSDGCHDLLTQVMKEQSQRGAQNFGNARYVGNLFGDTVKGIANRVAHKTTVTQQDVSTITIFDIHAAAKPAAPKVLV